MISYLSAKTSTASINPGMPCPAMLTNLLRKEHLHIACDALRSWICTRLRDICGINYHEWQPTENFRSSGRFELRNQNGRFGSVFTLGAAGRLNKNIAALAHFQRAQSVHDPVTNTLGTTGLTVVVSYSNDAGPTWTYSPASGACRA